MPRAYLMEQQEEVQLIPDWLKLKMIRSDEMTLVNAALRDLEPPQLVLFIQSFGIPVPSMSKLLQGGMVVARWLLPDFYRVTIQVV